MPFSGGKSVGGGENLNHFHGVKVRVIGSGNLQMTLIGFDSVRTFALQNLAMTAAPGFEPTKLADFISQRARLQGTTTSINNTFNINRIIVYMKEVYTEVPM